MIYTDLTKAALGKRMLFFWKNNSFERWFH